MRHLSVRLRRLLLIVGALASCAFLSAAVALGSVSRALACADALVLGASNSCDGQTSLSGSTTGPLLGLTNSGTGAAASFNVNSGPPFLVNSSTKVPNLNADQLDGIDSDRFAQGTTVAPGRGVPTEKTFFNRQFDSTRGASPQTFMVIPGFGTLQSSCGTDGTFSVTLVSDNGTSFTFFLVRVGGPYGPPNPNEDVATIEFHAIGNGSSFTSTGVGVWDLKWQGGSGVSATGQSLFTVDMDAYSAKGGGCLFQGTGTLQTN